MHGWETVETARCARCAIYTPTSDVVLGPDGRPYCLSCGAPRVTAARSPASARQPFDDEWVRPSNARTNPRVRLAVALMLVVTLAFPLAACVSQL